MGDLGSTQAATRVNAEQAFETGNAEADPPLIRGRLTAVGKRATRAPTGSAGVLAAACVKRETAATREAPSVARTRQPGIREDQPGPAG